jgi:hypothetical protein
VEQRLTCSPHSKKTEKPSLTLARRNLKGRNKPMSRRLTILIVLFSVVFQPLLLVRAQKSSANQPAPVGLAGDTDVPSVLGEGDSTFSPQRRFRAGDRPESVAVADLNGDNMLDVVTANFFSGEVSVLLGNGDGTFRGQRRFPAGVRPISVAVADLDGDNTMDLVTANFGSDDVSVLLQQ